MVPWLHIRGEVESCPPLLKKDQGKKKAVRGGQKRSVPGGT